MSACFISLKGHVNIYFLDGNWLRESRRMRRLKIKKQGCWDNYVHKVLFLCEKVKNRLWRITAVNTPLESLYTNVAIFIVFVLLWLCGPPETYHQVQRTELAERNDLKPTPENTHEGRHSRNSIQSNETETEKNVFYWEEETLPITPMLNQSPYCWISHERKSVKWTSGS